MSIFQLDFPFLLLSISQNWNSAFTIAFFGLDFPFPLLSISQNWNSAFTIVIKKSSSSSSRLINPNQNFEIHPLTDERRGKRGAEGKSQIQIVFEKSISPQNQLDFFRHFFTFFKI